jgi:hypothetical protein
MKNLFFVLVLFLLTAVLQARTITVNDDGPADFNNIQAAINDANNGDTVLVANGTYSGLGNRDIDFLSKAITVKSENGPTNCIIDCNGSSSEPHRGFYFHSGEGPNSVLDGFTIANGYTDSSKGGAIYGGLPDGPYQIGACPTIQNNILTGNYAKSGGAIANCDGIIQGNVITQNSANSAGGGLWHCDGLIQNNTVSYNTAGYQGAGICGSMGPIKYNLVYNNAAAVLGGGLNKCGMRVDDCIIHNNIVLNNSAQYGGGLCDCGAADIRNCIIWNNTASVGDDQIDNYDMNDMGTPAFCCIQDWTCDGSGNIPFDPCFVDPCNGDFHLKSTIGRWNPDTQSWVTDLAQSPCIDAGDPNCDWSGELWPHGKRINMGVYANTPQASMSVLNSGNVADLSSDKIINLTDFAELGKNWKVEENLLYEDLNRDGYIDFNDINIIADNWLVEYEYANIETDKFAYEPNETIVVSFENASGNPKDWVAIYKRVEVPGCCNIVDWCYTDGTQATGTTGIINSSVTFNEVSQVDDYQVVLFFNDSYVLEAKNFFAVKLPP